jgi:hypothetical protein
MRDLHHAQRDVRAGRRAYSRCGLNVLLNGAATVVRRSAPVPLYKFPSHTILFIHIPKAGGSTIDEYLHNHLKAPRALFNSSNEKRRALKLPCSPQHFHADALRFLIGGRYPDWSFAVVRDPLQRIISEYCFIHRRLNDTPEQLPNILDWFRQKRTDYEKNQYILDNHFRPQHEFLLENTEVFHFEKGLESILRVLAERLGLPLDEPLSQLHRNKSPKLPVTTTDEFVAEVRDFYRADYERFGYPLA